MKKDLASKNQGVVKERPDLNEKLKSFGSNVWQTFLLFLISLFLIVLLFGACQLGDMVKGDASPQVYAFSFVVFAFLAYAISLFIWDHLLPQIKSDYKFGWLAGFVFFSFAILGVAVFCIFMYSACIFWCDEVLSVRISAPLMGIVFFGSFIGKIMMD